MVIDRIALPPSEPGSGASELSLGLLDIWQAMVRQRNWHSVEAAIAGSGRQR